MTRLAIILAVLTTGGIVFLAGRWTASPPPNEIMGRLTCDDRGNPVIYGMMFVPLPYEADVAVIATFRENSGLTLSDQIDVQFHCFQPVWDR